MHKFDKTGKYYCKVGKRRVGFMNKLIMTMIAIVVVIGAVFTAVAIFTPKHDEVAEKIETKVAEEEILDDCTDEYEEMEYENTVKANTQEEKTSPNCSLTTKTYYPKCGHTKSEYTNLPEEFVNLTQDEIQEKFPQSKIEDFASNAVVLYQEKEGDCGEHYRVKDKEGMVTVYQVLEDGSEKEIETTGITTEYLPETDKINMKNGIQVIAKQKLNKFI